MAQFEEEWKVREDKGWFDSAQVTKLTEMAQFEAEWKVRGDKGW